MRSCVSWLFAGGFTLGGVRAGLTHGSPNRVAHLQCGLPNAIAHFVASSMGAAPTFLCRAADNLRYSSTELFDTGRDIAWKLLAEVGKGALCFPHRIADVAG